MGNSSLRRPPTSSDLRTNAARGVSDFEVVTPRPVRPERACVDRGFPLGHEPGGLVGTLVGVGIEAAARFELRHRCRRRPAPCRAARASADAQSDAPNTSAPGLRLVCSRPDRDARLWRIRGLLDRALRDLPSGRRRHLPLGGRMAPDVRFRRRADVSLRLLADEADRGGVAHLVNETCWFRNCGTVALRHQPVS